MRFLSTNLHGIFDYLLGIFFIASPWVYGYHMIGAVGTGVPTILGVGIIFYSLLTDYEWGVSKRISMKAHLVLDVLVGVTLLSSVIYFGFWGEFSWMPLIVAGAFVILLAAFSYREPRSERPRFRMPHVEGPVG